MSQSAYRAPMTAAEAAQALTHPGARALSGGTDLLVQMKSGRARPEAIIDLKRISGAVGVRETADGFVIGAMTPCAALGEHEGLVKAWPGVVEAANLIGSTQVQGRATLAGNVCNASPAADSVPALIAARAVCRIVGPNGERDVVVEEIASAPGRNTLLAGEFILSFTLPRRPSGSSDAYLRFIPRTEMDIAVVGVGVSLTRDAAGVITAAEVAVGAVAPTALRVADGGAALVGAKLDDAALAALSAAVEAVCRPISDKRGTAAFRTRTAGVLAARAAKIAHARAGDMA